MNTDQTIMNPKATKKSVVKHFDGEFYTKYLAKGYDLAIRLTGWYKNVGKHALEGISPCSMLDVGCGTGFIMDMARQKGFNVKGIDPSEGMIEKAIEKYAFTKDEICKTTADKLPYSDESFDFVFASGSLIYVPNMIDTVTEMSRVLKTGGTLRILDHSTPKKKSLLTPLVFLFTQASGYLIHDYEFYFSKHLKLVKHKTVGRAGYMQLFDFKKV